MLHAKLLLRNTVPKPLKLEWKLPFCNNLASSPTSATTSPTPLLPSNMVLSKVPMLLSQSPSTLPVKPGKELRLVMPALPAKPPLRKSDLPPLKLLSLSKTSDTLEDIPVGTQVAILAFKS